MSPTQEVILAINFIEANLTEAAKLLVPPGVNNPLYSTHYPRQKRACESNRRNRYAVDSQTRFWCGEEYIKVLEQKISTKQALILKDEKTAIGILLFSCETGSIDFMGSHPLYRKKGIPGN